MKKILFLLLLISNISYAQVNLNQGLIAYYPFNGNANDATGNGFNGTALNGVQLTTDRFGSANSAYYFDGIDDRILISDNGGLSPAKLTIACYFNADVVAQQMLIGKIDFFNGNGATYNMGVYNNSGPTASFSIYNENSPCNVPVPSTLQYSLSAPFSPGTNSWHCAIGTFENSVLKFYIDGVLISTDSYSFNNAKNCSNTHLIIGSWWSGQLIPFKGKIDDIRIYNRVLTQDEVSVLCPQASPLPVSLVSFNAIIEENRKVKLNWRTEQESDIDSYVVQRAIAESNNYLNIGVVQSIGNNNSQNQYSFIDNNLEKDILYYYRLQIKTIRGGSKYSPIRKVIINNTNHISVNIYPNPANTQINVKLNNVTIKNIQIKLYSDLGQLLFTKEYFQTDSAASLYIQKYSKGVYWVVVNNGNDRVVKKVIKY